MTPRAPAEEELQHYPRQHEVSWKGLFLLPFQWTFSEISPLRLLRSVMVQPMRLFFLQPNHKICKLRILWLTAQHSITSSSQSDSRLPRSKSH